MMSSARTLLYGGVAALGLLAGGGCGKPPSQTAEARPVPVRVVPVEYSDEAVPIRVPGIVSRRTEAALSFKIPGIIEEVRVRAGDQVRKGDVLARLRQDEIEAQVAQARSGLEKAQRDLVRVQRLREGNVATEENAQDASTAVDLAAAALRIAEFNRNHAVIVAPADGHILRRSAEPNELVSPGTAVVTFGSNADGWIVRCGLSERDVVRVELGDAAQVTDQEVGGDPVMGRVSHIADAADPATRTTEVEILLGVVPAGVRSGYVVAVELHPKAVEPRPVVPASALIEGADRRGTVFLVATQAGSDGAAARPVAQRVSVEVAEIDRDRVFLRTPLPRESQVIAAGAEYVREGTPLELVQVKPTTP